MHNYHLTIKSSNKKTGPIPVSTTSMDTCPDNCGLKGNGCYADYGPLGIHWKKVSNDNRGISYHTFIQSIKDLPQGQLWRHNQAGDLPGVGDFINVELLTGIVNANKGKHGFTYTHKPVLGQNTMSRINSSMIKWANGAGFCINLSADTLDDVDKLKKIDIGPVTVVLPYHNKKDEQLFTPHGYPIVMCLNETKGLTCEECKVCSIPTRKAVIGFTAHGSGKKKIEGVFSNVY